LFVAINKKGEYISIFKQTNTQIHKLKMDGPYFCPLCHEEVILKAGSIKLPHFSHKNICQVKGTGESISHLKGKTILYEWLMNQGFQVELEYFLEEVNQRPDLFVQINNSHFAIEFQCSVIPVSQLLGRINNYRQNGIISFWIIDDKLIKKYPNQIMELSDFNGCFIQNHFSNYPFILAIDTEKEQFIVYSNLYPYSSTRALYQRQVYSTNCTFKELINNIPQSISNSNNRLWLKYIEKWIRAISIEPNAFKNLFLQYLYRNHIHPLELPEVVGIPVRSMYLIKNSPFEWQAYIFIRFLYQQSIGTKFTIKQIENFLIYSMKKNYHMRHVNLTNEYSNIEPVINYLEMLTRLKFLERKGDSFIITKAFHKINNPGMERNVLREEFFKRNQKLLFSAK